MNELIFNYGSAFSLIVRLAALFISVWYVLRLMIRQAKVRNSLKSLRYLLLAGGVLIVAGNALSIYLLIDVVSNSIRQRPVNIYLQVSQSLVTLGISIIGALIYHLQFTQENIRHHEKIAREEEKKKEALI